MNKVILMGRLTRDPNVTYTQNANGDLAIARYSLAVDRRGARSNQNSEQQTADFINCVAFGKSAEFAEKYFHQGTKIVITGRIQTGSYTNKDGQKVYTTDVVVEESEFAESKNPNGGQNNSGNQNQNQNQNRNNGNQGYQNNAGSQGYQNNGGNQGYQQNGGNQGYQNNGGNQGYQNNSGSQGYQNQEPPAGFMNAPEGGGFQQDSYGFETGDGSLPFN